MFIQPAVEFIASDFNLLFCLFEEELKRYVSLPGSISFWFGSEILTRQELDPAMLSRLDQALPSVVRSRNILRQDGFLAVPIDESKEKSLGVIFHDIDPPLLNKISETHLSHLRSTITQCLYSVKEYCTDPISGRYNSRCLFELLKTDHLPKQYGFLFIVKVAGRGRGTEVGLAKSADIAFLLETVIGRPLFFLSSGVFVFFYETVARKALLEFSRKVVCRLRQNRFSFAHVASSALVVNDARRIGEEVFTECWSALESAQRVGPYGFKCGPSVYPAWDLTLRLPNEKVLAGIKAACRKHKRFALVLARVDGNKEQLGGDIETLLTSSLPAEHVFFPVNKGELYILLPDFSGEKLAAWGEEIKKQAPWLQGGELLSVGMCYWPCLRYSKADIILNCQKALLHGKFYGSGQVICFDNISLNVSGDYYFDEGDYRQAVKEYRLGLQLQADDINLMNSLGVALAEVNRQGQAASCFAEVLKVEPENYMALVNLGFAMRRKGRKEEAIRYLEKAYLFREESGDSLFELVLQLGDLYCFSGYYEKAVELFRQWEAEQFGRREFHFYRLLGEAQMEQGELSEAVRNLQKALQCYPGSTECMSMLGLLYATTGQGVEVGLSLCRKAISNDSYEAENWRRLGSVHLELNEYEEALSCARKGLRLKRQNNIRTKLLLATIYEKMEHYKKAKRIYQNLMKSPKNSENDIEELRRRLACLGGAQRSAKAIRG